MKMPIGALLASRRNRSSLVRMASSEPLSRETSPKKAITPADAPS
jgi:hypothetical protein